MVVILLLRKYNRTIVIRFCILILCVYFSTSCGVWKRSCPHKSEDTLTLSTSTTEPAFFPGVKQVVAFQDDLFSGSKPEGERGMHSLKKLNVSSIICVDGVAPDVDRAREYGIKTIHVPLKYNSPNKTQILDLSSAFMMNRVDGNVYIHCHHGKHRSAAAAALVSIALGLSNAQEMKERMQVAETSQHYTGLWEAVEQQQSINIFDVVENEKIFPSVVNPKGMTAQMVAIDEALDRLLLVKQSKWLIPESHPDLAPAADAGMIAETFRSMQLEKESPLLKKNFTDLIINAFHEASGLEQALKTETIDVELFDEYLHSVEQSCIHCHNAWRK